MMIKLGFLTSLSLSSLLLLSCSQNLVRQTDLIQAAKNFTHEGIQAFAEADQDRAKHWFNQALLTYKSIDNQKGLLETHINLAEVALSKRDYLIAQQHLQQTTPPLNLTTSQPHSDRITLLYAQIALRQKHYPQALKLLGSLLPKFKGNKPIEVPDSRQLTAIANRTYIAFAQKQNEMLWTQRYTQALRRSKSVSTYFIGRLLRFQAQLAQHEHKYQQAETLLQRALIKYKKNLAHAGIAATLSELGQLHMMQEHWQKARNYLNRSRDVLYFLEHWEAMIRVTEWLVVVEMKLGNLKRGQALNEWLIGMKKSQ